MWKRIYNLCNTIIYVRFTKKYVYLFILLNLILMFMKFWEFIIINPLQKNVYDLYLFFLSDYFFVVYLLSFLVIILFYRFNPNSKIYEYLSLKFKNKIEWFLINILSIVIITMIYAFGIVVLLFLLSIINLDFDNFWSEFAIHKYYIPETALKSFPPLSIVLCNLSLVYLYILTLGIMIYIGFVFFKNLNLSLIFPFMFISLSVITFLGKIDWLQPFSLTTHTLVAVEDYYQKGIFVSFMKSILYWMILIASLLTLGLASIKRKDFNWSEK